MLIGVDIVQLRTEWIFLLVKWNAEKFKILSRVGKGELGAVSDGMF